MRNATFGLALGAILSVMPDLLLAQTTCIIDDSESPLKALLRDLPGLTLTGLSDTGKSWTLQLGDIDPQMTIGPAVFTNGAGTSTDGVYTFNIDRLCQSYNGQASFICHKFKACSAGDGLLAMFGEDGMRSSVILDILENGTRPDAVTNHRAALNAVEPNNSSNTSGDPAQREIPRQPAANLSSAALKLGQEVLESYGGDNEVIDSVADASPYAAMAWAAYGGDNDEALAMAARSNWLVAEDADKFDLVEENLVAGDTVAMLFQRGDGSRTKGYVVAFRGSLLDGSWVSNTVGMFSDNPITTAQVSGAVKLARAVKAIHPEVTFTGHSLGGRLAQVAAIETDSPAIVFNSSPLSIDETADEVAKMLLDLIVGRIKEDKIQRFRSPEDGLTALAADTITIQTIPLIEEPDSPRYARWATIFAQTLGEQVSFAHISRTVALGAEATAIARDEGWVAAAAATEIAEQISTTDPREVGRQLVDAANTGHVIETENGCKLQTSINASWMRWNGECVDDALVGSGTITFYDGVEIVERLKVGPGTEFMLSEGRLYWVDDPNIKFIPGSMLAFSTGHFATVFAETLPGLNFHHFPTIQRIVRSAYLDYVTNRGFDNEPRRVNGLAVQISSSENQHHALMVVDKDGQWNKMNWSYNNKEADRFEREIRDANRQAVQNQTKQIQSDAVARIENRYRLLADGLTDESDALLFSGSGNLDALAHALEVEKMRTVVRLEEGIQLILPSSPDFDTAGQGEDRVYQVSYRVTSPTSRLLSRQRQELMDANFSWNDWMAQTSSVGSEMIMHLTCNFKDIADTPQQDKTVTATLLSLNTNGRETYLTLACE